MPASSIIQPNNGIVKIMYGMIGRMTAKRSCHQDFERILLICSLFILGLDTISSQKFVSDKESSNWSRIKVYLKGIYLKDSKNDYDLLRCLLKLLLKYSMVVNWICYFERKNESRQQSSVPIPLRNLSSTKTSVKSSWASQFKSTDFIEIGPGPQWK